MIRYTHCCVGVREFSGLDELDHHVGSNRNFIIV